MEFGRERVGFGGLQILYLGFLRYGLHWTFRPKIAVLHSGKKG